MQRNIPGHHGRKDDALYRARRTLHTGTDLLTDKQRFPMLGGSTANVSPCALWPTQPQSKAQITDRGPSNVLIAQNLRDPATPLSGARELRRAFGDRARMVNAGQGDHLVYQRFLNLKHPRFDAASL